VHVGELACRHGNGLLGICWLLVKTFPLWHCWQSRHMAATSLPTPFHTKRAAIVLLVARMPGCATLWMAWNTGRPIHQWYQWPSNATYHVSQQTGSLYLDSPHCQRGRLRRLQRAWTANLIGRHPVERDAYRRLHVSHACFHAR
jgi:hypothetical protein